MNFRAVLLLLLPLLLGAHPASGSPRWAALEAGWDFSLPREMAPDPYAGLLFMGQRAERPEIIHEGYTLTWAEMNPNRRKYDFSRPRELLDAAHRAGRGVLFRMDTFVTHEITPWGKSPCAVPQWVLDRHQPGIADMAGGDDATYPDCVIHIAVPWNRGVHKEHLRFIKAVGKSGLA